VTPNEWAGIGVATVTLISSFGIFVQFMVKSIMREFSPNGGQSLKDQVNRIEKRLDHLIEAMIKN
jgi:hypothetical protein